MLLMWGDKGWDQTPGFRDMWWSWQEIVWWSVEARAQLKCLREWMKTKTKTHEKASTDTFFKDHGYKEEQRGSSLVLQWVKDPPSLHLWHRLQLWCRFNSWSKNFHMPCVQGVGSKDLRWRLTNEVGGKVVGGILRRKRQQCTCITLLGMIQEDVLLPLLSVLMGSKYNFLDIIRWNPVLPSVQPHRASALSLAVQLYSWLLVKTMLIPAAEKQRIVHCSTEVSNTQLAFAKCDSGFR